MLQTKAEFWRLNNAKIENEGPMVNSYKTRSNLS